MQIILAGFLAGAVILVGGFWMLHRMSKGDRTKPIGGAYFGFALLAGFLVAIYATARVSPIAALALVLVAAVPVAFIFTPAVVEFLTKPITGAMDGGGEPEPPKPFYSTAIGRRKSGDVAGALAALAEQRERFPGDLTGVLLEADILRRDRRSPSEALACLEGWLDSGARPPGEVTAVLRDVAELHFEIGDGPAGRSALERIIALGPDSPAGQAAAQRLAHLADPAAAEKVKESLKMTGRTFARDIGLRADQGASLLESKDPEAERGRLQEKVVAFPDDWESKEALARMEQDAGNYGRAAALLEELAANTSAPAKTFARWLNQLADLHVHNSQYPAARGALQRIADRFPDTSHASLAESRIRFLPLEAKARHPGVTVAMPGAAPGSAPEA